MNNYRLDITDGTGDKVVKTFNSDYAEDIADKISEVAEEEYGLEIAVNPQRFYSLDCEGIWCVTFQKVNEQFGYRVRKYAEE
ncbi:hypothetical protein ACSLPC_28390 [Escherichia coli]|uniref:hypothetical protein n=1 Tax=Escherichia coli TaxID=562 RepID=UPI003EE3B6F2